MTGTIPLPWMTDAACTTVDPDLFFSFDPEVTAAAVRVCRGCPVRTPCAKYARSLRVRYGVWAGVKRKEKP